MKRILTLVSSIFIFIPYTSIYASVVISEVAWMGSAESANHEWIELYNDGGADVDVSGWGLTGGSLDIDLEGEIGIGQRVVLERTSDASAPGPAFLLYTGALSNGGLTLRLQDESGVIQDTVVGGEAWENVGGDNNTKQTAQLSDSQWVTAHATPGSSPPAGVQAVPTNEDVQTDEEYSPQTGNSGEVVRHAASDAETELVQEENSLQLHIVIPQLVQVNQSFTLSVKPQHQSDTVSNSVEYTWNTGTGKEIAGQDITHYFEYPGRYVVTVSGMYAEEQATARTEIQVIEPQLSLSYDDSEQVLHLINEGEYEVDVADYILYVDGTSSVFPAHTIILPGQSLYQKTIVSPNTATLFDSKQRVISTFTRQANYQRHTANSAVNQVVDVMQPKEIVAQTRVVVAPPVLDSIQQPAATTGSGIASFSPAVLGVSVSQSAQQATVSTSLQSSVSNGVEEVDTQMAALPIAGLPTQWPVYVFGSVLLLVILLLLFLPVGNDSYTRR